jgi:hypothetical protein
MRRGIVGLVFAAALAAHAQPTQGTVLERDSAPTGEFSIRLDTSEVLVYRFDAATRVDRENYPIAVRFLKPGERVEVVSELAAGSAIALARAVHVLVPLVEHANRLRRHSGFPDPTEALTPIDPLFARGDLAFSGIVARVNSLRLVLHTRQGDRTILLRDDTRYLDNGSLVTASALQPNMRVFVRAGRNLYDEMEGYQVVWGSFLEPK